MSSLLGKSRCPTLVTLLTLARAEQEKYGCAGRNEKGLHTGCFSQKALAHLSVLRPNVEGLEGNLPTVRWASDVLENSGDLLPTSATDSLPFKEVCYLVEATVAGDKKCPPLVPAQPLRPPQPPSQADRQGLGSGSGEAVQGHVGLLVDTGWSSQVREGGHQDPGLYIFFFFLTELVQ